MAIAPPNATVQITGAAGTITGDMSAYVVAPGQVFHPGSNGGPKGEGQEIATYVQNGTTGATLTFKKAFATNYSAGTEFYIPSGAVSGSAAYLVAQLQRVISYFQGIFGADLSIDSSSQQIPIGRDAGGTFARLFFYIRSGTARIATFHVGQRTVGGREVYGVQASPDGSQLLDGFEVNRETGAVNFRSAEGVATSAATVDLGAVRDRRIHVTGSGVITSFGSIPYQEKILRFSAASTLTHNATSLILPGGRNIVTAAGDIAFVSSDSAGNWRLNSYLFGSSPAGRGSTATNSTSIADVPITTSDLFYIEFVATAASLLAIASITLSQTGGTGTFLNAWLRLYNATTASNVVAGNVLARVTPGATALAFDTIAPHLTYTGMIPGHTYRVYLTAYKQDAQGPIPLTLALSAACL